MKMNRRSRRAAAASKASWVRVIPLFAEGEKIVHGHETYVMHTDPSGLRIVTVPVETCTLEQAKQLEAYLMDKMGRDVIVVTDNVRFLKVEPVPRAEVAELLGQGEPP